jgi:hypothetical protein
MALRPAAAIFAIKMTTSLKLGFVVAVVVVRQHRAHLVRTHDLITHPSTNPARKGERQMRI